MDLPAKMRCLGCGYDLRGLPENRCPECGRPFDPDDRQTFQVRLRSGRPSLLAAISGAILLMIAFLPALAGWGPGLGSAGFVIVALLIGVGLAIEEVVLYVTIGALRRPPGLVRHRGAAIAAFLISLTITVLFVASFIIPFFC